MSEFLAWAFIYGLGEVAFTGDPDSLACDNMLIKIPSYPSSDFITITIPRSWDKMGFDLERYPDCFQVSSVSVAWTDARIKKWWSTALLTEVTTVQPLRYSARDKATGGQCLTMVPGNTNTMGTDSMGHQTSGTSPLRRKKWDIIWGLSLPIQSQLR